MFERKITTELYKWKNDSGRKKALVIKGLRQIGKTTTVLAFAKENYEQIVYIDFKKNSAIKKVFNDDLSVDRITMDLTANMPDSKFIPGKTVLIFDEVQECSGARASLKYFMEDGRYDVICTGSLLGIKGYNRKKGAGVPVGSERILYMKPMDFEEFLWAKGIDRKVIDYLRDCYEQKIPVRESIHTAMLRNFREYICVGGLPYVVERFLTTKDMNVVYQEQRDILDEYKDDFGKHLDENEREETDLALLGRINRVFDSIPAQLSKENKKFVYSLLEKKGRSENYQAAIQWLYDAGIINICYNLNTIDSPLSGNKIDNVFKIYMQDSGLFIAMLEKGTAGNILAGELGAYKGAVYENIVADSFSKMDMDLYYFHKDNGLEIDFVTRESSEITLIEVKAKSGYTKSAMAVLKNKEKYHAEKCIKLSANNIGISGNIITIPYYMTFMLKEV